MLNVAGVPEILLIPAALVANQAAFGVLFGLGVDGKNQFAGRGGLGVVALRGFLAVGMRLCRGRGTFRNYRSRHRLWPA